MSLRHSRKSGSIWSIRLFETVPPMLCTLTSFRCFLRLSTAMLVGFLIAFGGNSSLTDAAETSPSPVHCEGHYSHHLQGVGSDGEHLYWSFTTSLVKTDSSGIVLKKVPAANHHGDLCVRDGKIYVAVNLGRFNDAEGNADSWVYVYDAETLEEISRHEVQEVFHGAGGIGHRDGHFFVVGGLPESIDENYVYEYDGEFQFVRKHVVASGHTHLGIQTAAFANGRWWFGCYGSPAILLVTDGDLEMMGRYEANCSLGIEAGPEGGLLVASGTCSSAKGCDGQIRLADPNEQKGFVFRANTP